MSKELRKHPRIDSLNLSYLCVDKDGTIIEQSMGRTLNVSESGICLETHFQIGTAYHLLLTIALEDDLIEVKGRVVFCRPGADDMFETGVEFTDMDDKAREVYKKYVEFFNEQQEQK
jgi:Tfp pilus assembly protein PilZ